MGRFSVIRKYKAGQCEDWTSGPVVNALGDGLGSILEPQLFLARPNRERDRERVELMYSSLASHTASKLESTNEYTLT